MDYSNKETWEGPRILIYGRACKGLLEKGGKEVSIWNNGKEESGMGERKRVVWEKGGKKMKVWYK